MALSVYYKGNIVAKNGFAAVNWLERNNKVSYVEWCPTGVKIGLNEKPIVIHQKDGDLAAFTKSVVTVGNNTAIPRVFHERISKKFDLMYSQRSFIHWYLYEGVEEGDFAEARENLGFLYKDYLDVLQEISTDRAGSRDEY